VAFYLGKDFLHISAVFPCNEESFLNPSRVLSDLPILIKCLNGDGYGPGFINPSVYYQKVRISIKVAVIIGIVGLIGEKWDSLETTLPFETTGGIYSDTKSC
jgi:hypothetical protein